MGWFENVIAAANPVAYLANKPFLNTGGGGGASSALSGSNASARENDLNAGYAKGKEIFYDDQDMKDLRARREDLAKGYSGEELGAIRETARGEVAGQRSNYLRSLGSNLARGGVGGARGAAIRGAADQNYAKTTADNERKMALDSANMVRTGTNDLQDFLFRQKYGMLGTGIGYGQLGVSDRAADAAAAANQPAKKGVLGELWDNTVGGLF